ncbi:MAG: VWA domain-containing protein [Gemmataceae bacterium]|nr:VWA domain-containing protein [Gemmataceae bacterium]
MSVASRLAAAAVVAAAVAAPARAADKPAVAAKPIDLVLCLDVSGSMNGLIDSAKLKLWDIVNELARLKPTPDLRVALYSYGHDTYTPQSGWVRKEVDLTADLDEVYKALNGLRTNGGTELVARVTAAALAEQKWSAADGALKVIFVCGNEAADQDKEVSLADAAARAKKAGVVVNTIYCGSAADGIAPGWMGFAAQCGGKGLSIDQNRAAAEVAVKTEFDAEILKLDAKLNGTYVRYGKLGADKFANQAAQDRNALAAAPAGAAAPTAALGRAASKAGALYRNSEWDLVDRMKEDKDFDLAKVPEDELPDELKKLKPEERLAYVKKKADERADIQKQVAELSAKRQKVVDAERAKQPKSDAEKALDEAVRGVVREQAKARGFEAGK